MQTPGEEGQGREEAEGGDEAVGLNQGTALSDDGSITSKPDDPEVAKKQCKPWTYVSIQERHRAKNGKSASAKIVCYSEKCVASKADCANKKKLLQNIDRYGNQLCQEFCRKQGIPPGYFTTPTQCEWGGCFKGQCPPKCPIMSQCQVNYKKGTRTWNCNCTKGFPNS